MLDRPSTCQAAAPRARGRSAILVLAVVALLARPTLVPAAVTVTASLGEALYSTSQAGDCASLHKLKDQGTAGGMEELPFNVVRLHATVPGVPDDQVRFRWSVRKPQFGVLIADQDIAGGESDPVIKGICAEFGTELGGPCVLSGDLLRAYSRPTVLWVAPTCDILPENTGKQFRGGRVRFKVKAVRQKRKLGKGQITVGFGRVASITLFANGKSGLGKPSGIPGGVRWIFSANTNPNGQPLPELKRYEFDNGGGDSSASQGACTLDRQPFDACALLDYNAAGKFVATVRQVFADDSAICDKITVQVLTCAARGDVQITRRPRVRAYTPGDPRTGTVDVTVRLRNRSIAENGLPPCDFLIADNALSCSEEARFAGGTSTKGTAFTLAELRLPTDVVPPGRSLVLLHREDVPLINVLPDVATITDIWTATTVNAGSYDGTDRYRIKGRPGVRAP